MLVTGRRRFCDRGADIPAIHVLVAQLGDPRGQPCVPDGGRTHVNTAAPRPEVEGGADDGHLAVGLRGHGRQG